MIRVLLIAGWRHHNYFKTDFFNGIGASRSFLCGLTKVF
jgi:hypothetical protein